MLTLVIVAIVLSALWFWYRRRQPGRGRSGNARRAPAATRRQTAERVRAAARRPADEPSVPGTIRGERWPLPPPVAAAVEPPAEPPADGSPRAWPAHRAPRQAAKPTPVIDQPWLSPRRSARGTRLDAAAPSPRPATAAPPSTPRRPAPAAGSSAVEAPPIPVAPIPVASAATTAAPARVGRPEDRAARAGGIEPPAARLTPPDADAGLSSPPAPDAWLDSSERLPTRDVAASVAPAPVTAPVTAPTADTATGAARPVGPSLSAATVSTGMGVEDVEDEPITARMQPTSPQGIESSVAQASRATTVDSPASPTGDAVPDRSAPIAARAESTAGAQADEGTAVRGVAQDGPAAAPIDAAAFARALPAAPAPSALSHGLWTASNDEPEPDEPPLPPRAPVRAATPRPPAIELPPLELLATVSEQDEPVPPEVLAETGVLIEQRLSEFKVPVTVVGASAGPVITRYEVEPATGVRGNQIVALMKDLARGLGRTSIRVVETIPGKTCMGLELPNTRRQMIGLADIFRADVYSRHPSPLAIAMGKDITGQPVVTDLAKAPHMLVAGTTGSGKSVAINAMILSLLYRATPEEVRLIMIDPKMLELSVYEGIPHLLAPVVTDMKLAANALNWCVGEMEERYRLMSELRVRNLAGYNQKIRAAREAGEPLLNPFPSHTEQPELLDTLPLIVVVIDELADLMMVAGKKIEELIARLAQKARAAGIHLILATQRPSVDVITGLIKANIPTRVAFQVSSKIDSRTILDQMGAESLLGQGDMLFLPPGTGYPQRVHGAFVADEEVNGVVAYLKQFGAPAYREDILAGPAAEGGGDLFGEEGAGDAEADPLYDEAVACVLRSRRASISGVQRQLRIGYNRAARLIEAMEAAGLVSPMGHNGAREVLVPGGGEG